MSTLMQLSRGSISQVALGILDEYGLADVSMRRIATALGVAPGALYWHIENKQELISNLAALILEPLFEAPGHAGTPATASATASDFCARLRRELLAHRDGAEVVIAAVSQPASPVARQLLDALLAAVEGERPGARPEDAAAAAEGLMHMTLGAAYVHQSTTQLAQATGGRGAAGEPGEEGGVDKAIGFLLAGLRSAGAESAMSAESAARGFSYTINPHD